MNIQSVALLFLHTKEISQLSMIFLFLIFSFFFLIILNHVGFPFPFSFSKTPLPPGPKPWPLLGNLLQIGDNPLVSITHFSHLYGPLISLKLGSQLMVVASSPAAASEILKTHDRTLSARFILQMTPDKHKLSQFSLVFSPECSDHWKFLRTTCRTNLFTAKALQSQTHLRRNKIEEMVEYLNSRQGSVVHLKDVTLTTIFNTLSNIVFSRDLLDYDGNEIYGFRGLFKKMVKLGLTPNLADFYPILHGLDLQGINKKAVAYSQQMDDALDGLIEERKRDRGRNVEAEHDFLDFMLENGFCNDQMRYLIAELLTAGTDTTTTTIEWAMAELMKNKHVMDKVLEEIKQQNNAIDESNISQLQYLHACIKEALRLYPPAPFLLPHKALQTCQIMGYTIPKDTRILVNIWAIGRDPAAWEDPLTFNPDRFIGSDFDFKGYDFRYLPFGSGRRICPGLPMAIVQVSLVLASLIQNFDWSLPNDEDPSKLDMTGKVGVVLHKEKPLSLIPKKRVFSILT